MNHPPSQKSPILLKLSGETTPKSISIMKDTIKAVIMGINQIEEIQL